MLQRARFERALFVASVPAQCYARIGLGTTLG
jgi:hypothetical protein